MPFNIDLHTHSFFSGDGISSPEDLIAAARAKGLNGLAITDHNTCDAVNYLLEKGLMRLDGLPVNDFLVLPGVEVTTADGHLLCIGAEPPYLKGKPAREVTATRDSNAGSRHSPHPYDLFRAGIRFPLQRCCDAIRYLTRRPRSAATTETCFQICADSRFCHDCSQRRIMPLPLGQPIPSSIPTIFP
jgi:hypothetical protein